jgi:hypothetical protein
MSLELLPLLKKTGGKFLGWFAGDAMPFEAVIIFK